MTQLIMEGLPFPEVERDSPKESSEDHVDILYDFETPGLHALGICYKADILPVVAILLMKEIEAQHYTGVINIHTEPAQEKRRKKVA